MFERAAINNRLATTIFIRADKRVPYEYVVQLENLVKKYDLKSLHALSGQQP
jgi:biopolymer transport protein ExbD